MTETTQKGRLCLDLLDKSRNVLDRSNLDEHSDDCLVGSSVGRSVEGCAGGTVGANRRASARSRVEEETEFESETVKDGTHETTE